MEKIKITTEYITLGQFLKLADFISTGGEAKYFLSTDVNILINNEIDKRRGRKIRPGDIVKIDNREFVIE